jgi:hypothetical protein
MIHIAGPVEHGCTKGGPQRHFELPNDFQPIDKFILVDVRQVTSMAFEMYGAPAYQALVWGKDDTPVLCLGNEPVRPVAYWAFCHRESPSTCFSGQT